MKIAIKNFDTIKKYFRYHWLHQLLADVHSVSLKPVRLLTPELAKARHVCLTIVCDDHLRLPYFLEYYRRLGIDHFLIVDNGSSDDTRNCLLEQPDCSIYSASSFDAFRKSLYGSHWATYLARKYMRGKWVLYIDVNEFLVFPYIDTRDISALTGYLEGMGRSTFNTLVVDCYSCTPLQELHYKGGNPLEQCPFFDEFGYVNFQDWFFGQKIVGGVEKRALYPEAPKLAMPLQKTPLVKWRGNFRFVDRSHILYPRFLNRCRSRAMTFATGCLLRFKYFSDLEQKLANQRVRFDPVEAEALRLCLKRENTMFWNEASRCYRDWRSLLETKLLGTGNWF